jgi:hypothetical protein
MTRRIARVTVKSGRLFNALREVRSQSAGQAWCCSARNLAPREGLNPGLRFTQSSNINSDGDSCGKLKATCFGRFFMRQDKVFPRRRRGGELKENIPLI